MDQETAALFAQLAAQLNRDRIEIEASLIAHRVVIEELLARQFAGLGPTFDLLIDECMQAARSLAKEPGQSEETRQELAAQVAARLAVLGQRVRGTL